MPKVLRSAAVLAAPKSESESYITSVSSTKQVPTKRSKDSWLDFTSYQEQRYMPALDGLRGVAVALVITVHLHHRMWGFLAGNVGVTIFFLLSGYLITRLALQEERSTGKLSLKAFYIRRSFRIFPMYYLTLAIYAALIYGVHSEAAKAVNFVPLLPYYLTYMQELPVWGLVHLQPGAIPFYQSWSLGVEEKFYLVWPVLLIAIPAFRHSWRLAVSVSLAVVCITEGFLVEGRHTYDLDPYGYIFFGVALALALSTPASFERVTLWAKRLLMPALLVALITQFVLMPHNIVRGRPTLYALAVTVLLVPVVSSNGLHRRILSTPALTLLGRISYGVYLLHILCLSVVERFFKPERGAFVGILAYLGTLLTSSALAYLLHRSFEKPLIQVGRRMSRHEISEGAAG